MFTLDELKPWLQLDQHKKLSNYIDITNQSLGINYDDYRASVNSTIEQMTGYLSTDLAVGAEFENVKELLISHFANILKYHSRGRTGRAGENVSKDYEHSIRELKMISKPSQASSSSSSGGSATIGMIDNLGGF